MLISGGEDLEDIVRDILQCENDTEMDTLLSHRTLMVTFHVVPYASEQQQWLVLVKLFVFGSRMELQKEAGRALLADLIDALCKPLDWAEAQSMQNVLQVGLTKKEFHVDLSLAILFSEIYCLTTVAMLLAWRQKLNEKKQNVVLPVDDKALPDFVKNCSDQHKSVPHPDQSTAYKRYQDSMLDHIQIHMQLAVAFLKLDSWSPDKRDVVGSIIHIIHVNSSESKSTEVKSKQDMKAMLSKNKPTKTESCLLLLYMASCVKDNPSSLFVCYNIFTNLLEETHGNLFNTKVKERKRLLVSCARFCLHMLESITSSNGNFFLGN
jgi:hypothetical protein